MQWCSTVHRVGFELFSFSLIILIQHAWNYFQKEEVSVPTSTTTTAPASSTESLLMSFLGGFLPFISTDADKTGVDPEDEEDEDIDYDQESQEMRMVKRLGLAAEVGDVESKR